MYTVKPTNVGRTVIVTEDELLRTLVKVIQRTRDGKGLITVPTIEEALHILSVKNTEPQGP
jgi:hypothetical protein